LISKNQLKHICFLKQKKYRAREGKFIVEGLRSCEELLASDFDVDQVFYCSSALATSRSKQFLKKCRAQGVATAEIDSLSFKKISSTVSAQGIAAVARRRDTKLAQFIRPHGCQAVTALWQVSDPGNLGTIIRSAAWFGIDAVLTSTDCAEATNPKAARATMGALFYIPVFQGLNFSHVLPTLANMGYKIFYADADGAVSISAASFSERNVILLGGETNPLPHHLSESVTATVRIPRYGYGDSLNVAAAAAIVMSEFKTRTSSH